MAKIALLIGVSDYELGLDGLPSAVNDAIAMQRVLTNPDMGEFDDAAVTVLKNPDRQKMEDRHLQSVCKSPERRSGAALFLWSWCGG